MLLSCLTCLQPSFWIPTTKVAVGFAAGNVTFFVIAFLSPTGFATKPAVPSASETPKKGNTAEGLGHVLSVLFVQFALIRYLLPAGCVCKGVVNLFRMELTRLPNDR